MKFSKAFVTKVKKLYPGNPLGIYEMAERGEESLGKMLEQCAGDNPKKIKLFHEFIEFQMKYWENGKKEKSNIPSRKRTVSKK